MSSLNDYTKLLGHGAQLCSLHIPSGHVARYSADDLAEFYYTVTVGRERAKRNIIGLPFAAHELRHMQSFNPSRHFGTCYLALACLAMGDSLAVELAQASHMEVLRTVAGCMLRSETVAFRRPFPRGDFCEFLCIDDHIAVQCLSRAAARASQPLRDTAVFRQAEAAYQQVNLVPHPVKKQRHQTRGTLLGAYFDGELGMVSAPLDRTLVLMLCTCEIARRGACTPQLLQTLLGSWIHVLMFRRPALCVLNAVFADAAARRGACTPQLLQTLLGSWIHVLMFRRPALCVLNAVFADAARMPATQIMRLSRNSRNELLCVSVLGPLLQTDLRASWCPKVFMMDASPSGAGLCEADATPSVVQELWRFSEQHGYHTRLEGPASAILREKGFESAVEYGEAPAQLMQDPFPLHPSLVEGVLWDCCELSAGITNWSTGIRLVLVLGHPRYLFVYAITAIQDRFPAFRGQMAPAWQIDRKWQHLEPGECRPVLSAAILRAMVALGLVWGWPRFVGVLLIGFLCMLHPAEYLSLTRADLLLPTDVLTKDRVAYVAVRNPKTFLCMLHPAEYLSLTRADLLLPTDVLTKDRVAYVAVRNPKTARFARRQHRRLEDASVLRFLEAAFESLPFDAMLYPGTKHTFKSQWNAILARLGIPYKQIDKGIRPGVLRGSGATHMYLETEDLSRVAWRGRWSRQKTLEFYVQEVAAQMIVQRLPED
eukprot:s162_g3.t1